MTPLIEAAEGWERGRRVEDDFDRRMEDLGVRRDERVRSVTSDIDGGGRRGESGCRSR